MKLNLSARFLMLVLLCGSCVLNTPKEELEYNGMNTLQISNVDDLISFYQYADDGKVSDYTWEELQNFRLKDPEGNITNYRIPTLEEAIRWARGKTILILDKKDVPMERTAQLITDMQAEPYVMITVHDGASARFFYEKNPNFMFEAFVKTKEAVQDYEDNGIPWSHIMAYVGPKITPEVREVIDMLHERGVMCMISTAPSDDKLSTPESRAEAYRMIIRQGVDIIESDRPIEVAEAISSLIPVSSSKGKFFSTL